MAKVKGTDIQSLRKIFKRRGAETEEKLLGRLSPKLSYLYQHALPVSWNPIEEQLELYEKSAQVLYPDDPQALRTLGREMAQETFTGIYKIFLSIPTPAFIIKQAAMIWKQYYDKGHASVETVKEGNKTKRINFIVSDFPELPPKLAETICGYLMVLADITGEKNASIQLVNTTPGTWRWEFDLNS